MASVGGLAASIIALIYSQMSWAKKIMPKIRFSGKDGVMKVITQSLYDGVAGVFLFISIATIIRYLLT